MYFSLSLIHCFLDSLLSIHFFLLNFSTILISSFMQFYSLTNSKYNYNTHMNNYNTHMNNYNTHMNSAILSFYLLTNRI